jgi:hypothetical protein
LALARTAAALSSVAASIDAALAIDTLPCVTAGAAASGQTEQHARPSTGLGGCHGTTLVILVPKRERRSAHASSRASLFANTTCAACRPRRAVQMTAAVMSMADTARVLFRGAIARSRGDLTIRIAWMESPPLRPRMLGFRLLRRDPFRHLSSVEPDDSYGYGADSSADAQLTVIERGLARRPQQEVGPPDRKLWVRRAR